jgi:hypothetical protein
MNKLTKDIRLFIGLFLILMLWLTSGCVEVSDEAMSDYQWQQANPNWRPPTDRDPRQGNFMGIPGDTPGPTTIWP